MAIHTSWTLPPSSSKISKGKSPQNRNWEDRQEREEASEVVLTKDFLRNISKGALDISTGWSTLTEINLNLGSLDGRIREVGNLADMLPNLISVNLSFNALTSFDGGGFHHLRDLNLAENSITQLTGLSGMSSLVRLNLSGNKLERMPTELYCLTALSTLRLKRNNLGVSEDVLSLASLHALKSLSIGSNPWNHQQAQEFALNTLSLTDLDGVPVDTIQSSHSNRSASSNNTHHRTPVSKQRVNSPISSSDMNDSQLERDAELSALKAKMNQTEGQRRSAATNGVAAEGGGGGGGDFDWKPFNSELGPSSQRNQQQALHEERNTRHSSLSSGGQQVTFAGSSSNGATSGEGGDRGMLRAQNSELRTMCSELKLELEAQSHRASMIDKKYAEKMQEMAKLIEDAEGRAKLGHDTSLALDAELQRTQALLENEKKTNNELRSMLEQDQDEKQDREERQRRTMVQSLTTMVKSLKVESPNQVVESVATLIAIELGALAKEDDHITSILKTSESEKRDWAVEASLRVSCKLLNAVSLSRANTFPSMEGDVSDWSDKLHCGSLGDLAKKVRNGITSLPKLHSLERDLSEAQAKLEEVEMKVERSTSRLSALHASCDDTSKRCKSLSMQEERLKVGMATCTAKFEEVDLMSKEAERQHHEDMVRNKAELFQLKEQCNVQEKRRLACEEASNRAKQALQDLFDRCERAKKDVQETEGRLSSERAELETLRASSEIALAEARSGLATATGERRVAEEMVASLRREALELDRARSSARRAEGTERAEASRKLDELNVQVHDKEARLQRLVRELEASEDVIKSKEAQFKSRFAVQEAETKAKCSEMIQEAENMCKTKTAELDKLNEKCKSAEQKLALLKLRREEEEETLSLRKTQIEAKMGELVDMVATSEQQVEFAKRTAARVLKVTEERQAVASELGHRITSNRLAAEEAEQRRREAEEAVKQAVDMESEAERKKARTLQEMSACRENADAIKMKVQEIEVRMREEEDRLCEVEARVQESVELEDSMRKKVNELKKQVVKAHDDKATLIRESDELKHQIEQLKHELDEVSTTLSKNKSRSVEAAERAVELEQKTAERLAGCATAERSLNQLERKLVELQEEEKGMMARLRELQTKCATSKRQCDALDQRALDAQAIITSSTHQTAAEERSMLALRDQQSRITASLEELRRTKEKEEDALSSTKAELHSLELSKSELMSEVKRLRASAVELKEQENKLSQQCKLASEAAREAREEANIAKKRAEEAAKLEATSSARAVAEGRRLRLIEAEIAKATSSSSSSSAFHGEREMGGFSNGSGHDGGGRSYISSSRLGGTAPLSSMCGDKKTFQSDLREGNAPSSKNIFRDSHMSQSKGRSALADLADEVQLLSQKLQDRKPSGL